VVLFNAARAVAGMEGRDFLIPDDVKAAAPPVLRHRLLLKPEGFAVEAATSPAGVLDALGIREFDAVLIDLNYARDTTSGQEGLDLLSRIQAIDSTLPVIVMTAWGSVEVAVEAMRRGARDFVQKPWENQRLLSIIRTQVDLYRSLRRAEALRAVRQAESRATQNEAQATLGRYMLDMKPSVNNALTSMLGNAELLLLEPGQLSQQSLAQIKTIHSMALRINEIMQRFSSLASEMREAENASQAETHAVLPSRPVRR